MNPYNRIGQKLPVEHRLNMINDVYKSRREERVHDEYRRQKENIKPPNINPNSKKIVETKYKGSYQQKVEDRLYEDHRKRQLALDMKQKILERQAQAMAKPNINPQNQLQESHSLSTHDGKKIVARFMEYKQKYTNNEEVLKEKHVDRECTFQPKINSNSRKYANQMSFGMPLEFRNCIDVSKYNSKSKIEYEDKNCTFKPEVSLKSKEIAEMRNSIEHQPHNVFQRLGSQSQPFQKEDQIFSFNPVINPVSEEIDYNISQGNSQPRWERLYMLQQERIHQQDLRRQEQEFDRMQQEQECTFQPQILSKSKERNTRPSYILANHPSGFAMRSNTSESSLKSSTFSSPLQMNYTQEQCFDDVPILNMNVHQRSELWKQNKQNKIQSIREKNKGKGMEECTFKPKTNRSSKNLSALRSSNSLNHLQTKSSIQKYVYRMNKVREQKDNRQVQEDRRVGSGKNWTHRITVPREPSLSYQKGRSKGDRRKGSMERDISRELLARNISLQDIKTKEYLKDDEFRGNFHNHYYQENDDEPMLQSSQNFENLKQNRHLIAKENYLKQ